MNYTGVFATDEERRELTQLGEEARNTPVIAVSSAAALGGKDLSSLAWEKAMKKTHEMALSHSLPEIQGYYGLTRSGEFVTA